MIEEYSKQKEALVNLYDTAISIVESSKCDHSEANYRSLLLRLDEGRKRLIKHKFELVIVGEFSSGKTFLLNFLLGKIFSIEKEDGYYVRGLLPTRISPTTSSITRISYNETEKAVIRYSDGAYHEVPLQDITSYVADDKHKRKWNNADVLQNLIGRVESVVSNLATQDASPHIEEVELYLNCEWLKNGIDIVDTPGTGSVIAEHAEITERYLPHADAVLFLFPTQPPINNTTRLFLTQNVFNQSRIFCIETMIDREFSKGSDGEGQCVWKAKLEGDKKCIDVATKQNSDIIAQIFHQHMKIWPISALWAASCALDLPSPGMNMSGLPSLIDDLEAYLIDQTGQNFLNLHASILQEQMQLLQRQMLVLLQNCNTGLDDVSSKLAQYRDMAAQMGELLSDITASTNADQQRLAIEIESQIRQYLNGFDEIVFKVLNQADIAQLKKDSAEIIVTLVQTAINEAVSHITTNVYLPHIKQVVKDIQSKILNISTKLSFDVSIGSLTDDFMLHINNDDITYDTDHTVDMLSAKISSAVSTSFHPIASFLLSVGMGWLVEIFAPGQAAKARFKVASCISQQLPYIVQRMSSIYTSSMTAQTSAIIERINQRVKQNIDSILVPLEQTIMDYDKDISEKSTTITLAKKHLADIGSLLSTLSTLGLSIAFTEAHTIDTSLVLSPKNG